ncbi:multidrug resistance-associated protein 4-like [Oryzias latipes]|uniref:multidrug resistance-associated protein 4-like n=1 Tax=Oryzias latipes TaxID=8090 RepID=UPI000CE24DA7|nr:multidrug resistance-associated protein 4-like [Oryzias latipes]
MEKLGKTNPAATANIFSKLFFWWLNPLFRIGSKRRLDEDDIFEVLPEDRSDHLGEELKRLFPSGVATANKLHGKLGNVSRRMPFLTQPSQSNRVWDRHRSREGNREQPGPWFHGRKALQTSTS